MKSMKVTITKNTPYTDAVWHVGATDGNTVVVAISTVVAFSVVDAVVVVAVAASVVVAVSVVAVVVAVVGVGTV